MTNRATELPDAERLELIADAIDEARYQHPDHPRERPRPFSEADRSDREYAFRLARAILRTPPREAEAGLLAIHSALDDALGDTDISHVESDEEMRSEYPVQWAAEKLMLLINEESFLRTSPVEKILHDHFYTGEPGEPEAIRDAAKLLSVRTHAHISELDDASNACLELAAKHGFATGHGDTVADMIREFSAQITHPASQGSEAGEE